MTSTKPKKKVSKEVSDAYAIVGRAGGKATAKRLGKKGMAELGRKGAEKRWGKKKPAKKSA